MDELLSVCCSKLLHSRRVSSPAIANLAQTEARAAESPANTASPGPNITETRYRNRATLHYKSVKFSL